MYIQKDNFLIPLFCITTGITSGIVQAFLCNRAGHMWVPASALAQRAPILRSLNVLRRPSQDQISCFENLGSGFPLNVYLYLC